MNTERDNRILDCGHKPSPHSDCTTGTAHTQDGREICWECSYQQELKAMSQSDRYSGYISEDGKQITTWPGQTLATITYLHTGNHNMAGKMTYFRAVAKDGSHWHGRGHGLGMLCHLRRSKAK